MPSEEMPSLPPGLDLLWGRRSGGRRGPKPGLSVDAIVKTAMAIADAEGLDAVSMARVAQRSASPRCRCTATSPARTSSSS